jgi:hypothetical protein
VAQALPKEHMLLAPYRESADQSFAQHPREDPVTAATNGLGKLSDNLADEIATHHDLVCAVRKALRILEADKRALVVAQRGTDKGLREVAAASVHGKFADLAVPKNTVATAFDNALREQHAPIVETYIKPRQPGTPQRTGEQKEVMDPQVPQLASEAQLLQQLKGNDEALAGANASLAQMAQQLRGQEQQQRDNEEQLAALRRQLDDARKDMVKLLTQLNAEQTARIEEMERDIEAAQREKESEQVRLKKHEQELSSVKSLEAEFSSVILDKQARITNLSSSIGERARQVQELKAKIASPTKQPAFAQHL